MKSKISIINYKLGNLESVKNAVKNCDFDCEIISDPKKDHWLDKN